MKKIENWDNIEVKGVEDFKALPIGAYICKIINAVEYTSEESGKTTLKVMVDIDEGEFKDYFKKRYDSNTSADKRWDNNATRYLAFDGENIKYFKGFITCVEKSNDKYTWNWDEKTLRDKKIIGVFQYEQYIKQDGGKGIKVRLSKFRSVDKLNEIVVSDAVRTINGEYVSYEELTKQNKKMGVNEIKDLFGDIVEDKTSDLPF